MRLNFENKISYIAKEAGYKLINPTKTIISNYINSSGVRNYKEKYLLPNPYHFIPSFIL